MALSGVMPRRPEQTEGLLSASGMRHGIHGTPSRSKSMMIDTLVAWGILIKSVFLSRNRIVVSKPMGRKNGFLGASRGACHSKEIFVCSRNRAALLRTRWGRSGCPEAA